MQGVVTRFCVLGAGGGGGFDQSGGGRGGVRVRSAMTLNGEGRADRIH